MKTQWSFDPSHSSISFAVRHLMISKVRGNFGKWSGSFDYDAEDPTRSKIVARIAAASIDTREEKRDAHLRSADFLDAEKFPELVFESTSVRRAGDDYVVAGNLTIRGVTRPVELQVESLGGGKDPWGNQRVAFAARTAIARKEFGLNWNQALEAGGVLVGDKVEIEIDVQAVAQASTEAA